MYTPGERPVDKRRITIIGWLTSLALNITAPHAALTDVRDRQQARLIASLGALMLPITAIALYLFVSLLEKQTGVPPRLLFSSVLQVVAVYTLSRTPAYGLAITVFTFGTFIVVFSVIEVYPTAHSAVLAVLPVYVTSIFRSAVRTAASTVVCILLVSAMSLSIPGDWQNVSLTILFILVSSALVGSSSLLLRVTERRLTDRNRALLAKESFFRIALDNSRNGFFILQGRRGSDFAITDFIVLELTRALTRDAGIERDAVIGKPITNLISPALIDDATRVFIRCLVEQKPIAGSFSAVLPVIGTRHYEYEVLPIDLDILALNVTDTTERRAVEQQQIELAIERERVELLRKFIGDASHDLMTPITIIKTGLYLMKASPDPAKRTEQTAHIEQQVDRLQRMLRDMIALSRMDQESPSDREFGPIDLNDLLESLIQDYQDMAAIKQQSLTLMSRLPTSTIISGDVNRLETAFANLLENALKYTGDKGQVTIRARVESGVATIEIQDSGPGFTADDLSHSFERFYRGEQHRPTTSGSGLGMSITQKIIEAHEGTISACNAPEGGALLTITLPIQHTAAIDPLSPLSLHSAPLPIPTRSDR